MVCIMKNGKQLPCILGIDKMPEKNFQCPSCLTRLKIPLPVRLLCHLPNCKTYNYVQYVINHNSLTYMTQHIDMSPLAVLFLVYGGKKNYLQDLMTQQLREEFFPHPGNVS
jgi:hypothetical protein